MSKGREFKPCARVNGKVMMRVNIEPVVLDKSELQVILFDRLQYLEAYEVASMTKKQIKEEIKYGVSHYAYAEYVDNYQSREQILDCENADSDNCRLWDCIDFVIDKYFPEFKTEQRGEEE